MFSRHRSTSPAAVPFGSGATMPSGPSLVEVIDDDSFFDRTAGGVTIVDFWAPWCGPCHIFAPIFDQAASDYEGRVRFAKCNVDVSPTTAGLLQVQGIPTLIIFGPDGSELGRVSGVLPRRQLDELIERLAPGTQASSARQAGEQAV